MKIFRKQTLLVGGISVSVVAAAAVAAVSFLGIESSRAAFQKAGQSQVEVSAGNLEFTMTELENVDVSKAGDTTFDSTGVTVATTPVGNTTTGGKILSYTESFNNIYPGWSAAYGFEVKNTGSLDSFLDMYLGSAYLGTTDDGIDWNEQDPRTRIAFTVYSGEDLTAGLAKLASGYLQGNGEVIVDENTTTTENAQYGSFQYPGKIPGTSNELEGTNDVIYYIIKLEFVDNEEGWVGNNSGDNIYEDAKIKVNFAIGTAGPLETGFEFATDAEPETSAANEEESSSTTEEESSSTTEEESSSTTEEESSSTTEEESTSTEGEATP